MKMGECNSFGWPDDEPIKVSLRRGTMKARVEISRARAKKLVKAWNGHVLSHTECDICAKPETKCPVHKFFKELEKKFGFQGDETYGSTKSK